MTADLLLTHVQGQSLAHMLLTSGHALPSKLLHTPEPV